MNLLPSEIKMTSTMRRRLGIAFVILTGAEPSNLPVADDSNNNVDITTKEKRMITNLIDLKLITIPAQSVFADHGYLKHDSSAWSGTMSIHYHM